MKLQHESLTAHERAAIAALCTDRLAWSDGGHWLGSGSAPDCGALRVAKAVHSVAVYFSSDGAADRWNAEYERNIRIVGHGGTVLLGLVGFFTGGSIAAASAIVAASIAKDESQSRIAYPRASRDSRLSITIELELRSSVHPHQRDTFRISRRMKMVDHIGSATFERTRLETLQLAGDTADILESGKLMRDSDRSISL